jgi:hypothetical protein
MDFWHYFDDDDDDPDWQENYNRGHTMGAVIILVLWVTMTGTLLWAE